MCSIHIIPNNNFLFNIKFMEFLHFLIIILLICCSFFVIFSDNPVHSVLFLILCFCDVSLILFLFNVEFLSILFLIIYVGAIAVLFLFVVMMLNVKSGFNAIFIYKPLIILSTIILVTQIFLNIGNFFYDASINKTMYSNYSVFLDSLTNIDIFGQALFNNFLICFLIAGLILLVAMIGAIVLTFVFKSEKKNELFFKQLSRSDNSLSFLIN